MKHYILFKFQETYFNQELVEKAKRTYQQIQEAIPDEILHVEIVENCVTRDVNFDLMICVDLASEESLNKYLQHPIHTALVTEWIPHIKNRGSFDCIL